jgi:hypothetical protein
MTKRLSFTKNLNKVLPRFRENMSNAESTEDVKKFFFYTVRELLEDIFKEEMEIKDDDIKLLPNKLPYFSLSPKIIANIKEAWKGSDLPHLIEKLAESAIGRFKHLEKHPEKTESKIRM